MTTIISRNLNLYFKEKTTIFFSLLTSLIILVLYFAFLKQNYTDSLKSLKEGAQFADIWLLAGLLSVTGMTTTFQAMTQLVVDKTTGRMRAFRLTQTSRLSVFLGYFFSSVIIGILMQVAILAIGFGILTAVDGIGFSINQLVLTVLAIILNSLVSAALSLILLSGIKKRSSLTSLGTIIGTLSGFLSGVYIPMSALPEIGQNIIKFYPGAYSASLFRHILLADQFKITFASLSPDKLLDFKAAFGIGLSLNGQLTTAVSESILLLFATLGL
ncbi:MAG: ABC transporter permease, partial [Lactococcus plantarum]|nr:ABC transporter permease [Lactococcus plantarum]